MEALETDPSVAWWDVTWNPVRGCSRTSTGCNHCFAARYAERWRGVAGHPYERGFDPRPVPEKLDEPFRWASSKKVLVASISDLFHEDLPDEFVGRVLEVMRLASWHHYFVLTKRPDRMHRFVRRHYADEPLGNVWLGVSAEDRKHARSRITKLNGTPAVHRFLCLEPLIADPGELDLRAVDWVVLGGESGPGARTLEPEWARSVRQQCRAARVPFFFKQWGGARHGASGRELDGKTPDRLPALRQRAVPSREERLRRREVFADAIGTETRQR